MASLRQMALAGLMGFGLASPAFAAVEPAVLQAEAARVQVVKEMCPTVVAIFDAGAKGGGSGVLVSNDGFAVTNFHVVGELGGFMKCGLNDGKVYDAVLVGIDPTGDVALIKLLGRDDFPAAKIGNSDELQPGDWAWVIGNPFLLATDFQPTVTYGIVSGTHRYQYPAGTFLEYTDCIQIDASINPGNSGGPLFNSKGELVGINGRGSFEKRGRVNVGVGYAISINQVMHFIDHLKSGRVVDHATLGATVQTNAEGDVIIANILEQSEAYRRGLRSGDELVTFAGRPIRSVNQFKNILGIYPKGWRLPISYTRDGQKTDTVVRLRALHRNAELNPAGEEPKPPQPPQPDPEKKPKENPLDPHGEAKNPPPEKYKHLYEEKAGYANFYFNRIARDRLMASVKGWGEYKGAAGAWTFAGKQNGKVDLQLKLTDAAVGLKSGMEAVVMPLNVDPTADPPGSGGLLLAFAHLRQLLLDPEGFTEFYYLGSEPFDGTGPMVDVLVTTRGLTTTRWYFARPEPRLLGWDTSVEEDLDECEIRIAEMGTLAARQFPRAFTVTSGGKPYAEIKLESADWGGK
ncbi:S1C family serine protease [Planctomyces sp. SH-PL14]|uniref:S1C family serine protease n=1 Tax=Planctomyces sp. SH-PL14 TaxID=1632864 RepID=UPI00078D2B08|nr:trypsin-like peptidase domain-containing protein [Planctomyces sp. SH-PL14]AMV20320.1 Periplasmic serine endoprotease DegP precursor [Planctomyces sp. SH-PL14]